MIARLSHGKPLGRPGSAIIGARAQGWRERASGVRAWPWAPTSSTGKPAARIASTSA